MREIVIWALRGYYAVLIVAFLAWCVEALIRTRRGL